MIDQREPVSALLELAIQATTDGVRTTALRRIAALADADLDRARGTADNLAMREALRPAVHALARHPAIANIVDNLDERDSRPRPQSSRSSDGSAVDRFLRNALLLGVPVRSRSHVVIDARVTRCGRRLLCASPLDVARVTRDVGCLVCAVLLRDLDRTSARTFLGVLGSGRSELGRLAQFVPAHDEGLLRWTVERVGTLELAEKPSALSAIGSSLVRSLTIWMESDVAVALRRRLGFGRETSSDTPRGWLDAFASLVEENNW